MTEKSILSVILHNPNLMKDFSRYHYKFKDKDCSFIYRILVTFWSQHKIFDLKLISNHILEKTQFNILAFNEIIDIDFVESNYKIYLSQLLKNDLEEKIKDYCLRINDNKNKSFIDVKHDILKIANEIIEIEEKEIEDSKNICRDLLEELKTDYSVKKFIQE